MLKTTFIWFVLINLSWISCFFKFFILSLFLENSPYALHVNLGCFKFISGINLSPANNSLFIISFILYFQNKVFIKGKSLRISIFTPFQLLNYPLVSCSLRNFEFLLLHSKKFDKNILPFLVHKSLVFTFCIFSTFQTIR